MHSPPYVRNMTGPQQEPPREGTALSGPRGRREGHFRQALSKKAACHRWTRALARSDSPPAVKSQHTALTEGKGQQRKKMRR